MKWIEERECFAQPHQHHTSTTFTDVHFTVEAELPSLLGQPFAEVQQAVTPNTVRSPKFYLGTERLEYDGIEHSYACADQCRLEKHL